MIVCSTLWTGTRKYIILSSKDRQKSEKVMDLKNFEKQIAKTGFPLEYRISSLLRSAGWTVINNRYYVDDQEQSVREIDLVAYKARPVQHFNVFTTLIISCKKSDQNVWALLARKKDPFDP